MITVAVSVPSTNQETLMRCVQSLLCPEAILRLVPWQGGYAKTMNLALQGVTTEWVACVNTDTVAPPQWATLASEHALVCPAESSSPSYEPTGEVVRDHKRFFGGFWLLPTSTWNTLGGFDEQFNPAYCEDTDLMVRVEKLGLPIIQDKRVKVLHHQNLFLGKEKWNNTAMNESVKKFIRKWGFDPIHYHHG
jgi:hypothetical protein